MPKNSFFHILICSLLLLGDLYAQRVGRYLGDETAFYAETKQVNQFFRRFNHEEDRYGRKYEADDPRFREKKERLKYLEILFDSQSQKINPDLKDKFIRQVTKSGKPFFLDFHGGQWFAEVAVSFATRSKEEEVVLFLELEPDRLGSKWSVFDFFSPKIEKENSTGNVVASRDTTPDDVFLHPLSHELNFMNLRKTFDPSAKPEWYAAKDCPEHLLVFFQQIKEQRWTFNTVGALRFHFFQVPGWYFELTQVNRPGLNTGWLISDLIEVPQGQEEVLKKYILEGKKN